MLRVNATHTPSFLKCVGIKMEDVHVAFNQLTLCKDSTVSIRLTLLLYFNFSILGNLNAQFQLLISLCKFPTQISPRKLKINALLGLLPAQASVNINRRLQNICQVCVLKFRAKPDSPTHSYSLNFV